MPKRKRDGSTAAATSLPSSPPADDALPFQEQQITLKMTLLPVAMEDIAKHVQVKLKSLLMKYNEEAGGVMLSLSNVRLPADHRFATIMDDLPFLHVHAVATALVFHPSPGIRLKGTIIKVASTHVAMLVYGIFNAAVATEDMPDGFEYDPVQGIWRDESSGDDDDDDERGEGRKWAIGNSLDFRVLRVHEAAGLISMDASLRTPEEGTRGRSDSPPAYPEIGGAAAAAAAAASASAPKSPSTAIANSSKKKRKQKRSLDNGGSSTATENGGGGGGGVGVKASSVTKMNGISSSHHQQPAEEEEEGDKEKRKKAKKRKRSSGGEDVGVH